MLDDFTKGILAMQMKNTADIIGSINASREKALEYMKKVIRRYEFPMTFDTVNDIFCWSGLTIFQQSNAVESIIQGVIGFADNIIGITVDDFNSMPEEALLTGELVHETELTYQTFVYVYELAKSLYADNKITFTDGEEREVFLNNISKLSETVEKTKDDYERMKSNQENNVGLVSSVAVLLGMPDDDEDDMFDEDDEFAGFDDGDTAAALQDLLNTLRHGTDEFLKPKEDD